MSTTYSAGVLDLSLLANLELFMGGIALFPFMAAIFSHTTLTLPVLMQFHLKCPNLSDFVDLTQTC